MRKKRIRRELVALGHETPFEPTEEMRKQVQVYVFNGLEPQRIAQLLGIHYDELVYHFAHELQFSEDELVGFASSRMFYLAGQNTDLGVSLRASQHIVQARSRRWRIPKDDPTTDPGSPEAKRIGKMTLKDVEQELADLDRRRRASASAPPEEG